MEKKSRAASRDSAEGTKKPSSKSVTKKNNKNTKTTTSSSDKNSDKALRIDIGCGKNKRPGFIGVDQYAMDGVDVVMDVRQPWPWKDNSVDEAHCSHFLEHLTGLERVYFMNELHRVLKPGSKATVITPHWASNRAYGDFTHQWPPVSEMFYYYLSNEWRTSQAPHTDKKWNKEGYSCNFQCSWGYGLHPAYHGRDQKTTEDAIQWNKEAITDMVATLVKLI